MIRQWKIRGHYGERPDCGTFPDHHAKGDKLEEGEEVLVQEAPADPIEKLKGIYGIEDQWWTAGIGTAFNHGFIAAREKPLIEDAFEAWLKCELRLICRRPGHGWASLTNNPVVRPLPKHLTLTLMDGHPIRVPVEGFSYTENAGRQKLDVGKGPTTIYSVGHQFAVQETFGQISQLIREALS